MTRMYNVKKKQGGTCKMWFNVKTLRCYVQVTTVCIAGIRYI